MNFVSNAWAQGAGAAPAAGSPLAQFFGGGGSMFVTMGLMLAVLYFMVIRPQGQERKKLERAIAALKKGDRVLTTGGMFGTVVSNEKDRLVLRIADDVKAEFAKTAIAQVLANGDKG